MKTIRVFLAVALCKALHTLARLLRRGGTAFPGRMALKLCPGLLSDLAKGVNTVVITGTNGKTTSARMVEQALLDAGLDCMANRSGANLNSGITTVFALHSSLGGRCRKPWAVIECDEGACRRTLGQLKPRAVLVTNLFEDQLDRYGDVNKTLENIRAGLESVPETVLVLNADCSLTASLAALPNPRVFYGLEQGAVTEGTLSPAAERIHCVSCGGKLNYDFVNYDHLGGWRCERCGAARPDTDVGIVKVEHMDAEGSSASMRIRGETLPVRVNLPALYNTCNAAGAIAAAMAVGVDTDTAVQAMAAFKGGFGRLEHFAAGKAGATMMLAKNAAGYDQVIAFLCGQESECELVFIFNNNESDGRDISWLADVNFEKLAGMQERIGTVLLAGMCAQDLRERLEQAGFAPDKLVQESSYETLALRLAAMERPIFIIPNYTGMMEFRPVLVKHCGGSQFWEG